MPNRDVIRRLSDDHLTSPGISTLDLDIEIIGEVEDITAVDVDGCKNRSAYEHAGTRQWRRLIFI